jgi:hypothetical protein
MHPNSTAAPADRHAKRERLKELLERLGPDCEPPAIREHAYREGIGQIHPAMLIAVRNELWPDRKRRTTGRPPGTGESVIISKLPPGSVFACPECRSHRIRICAIYRPKAGGIKRTHRCNDCGHRYVTHSADGTFYNGKAARRATAESATHKSCLGCRRVLPIDQFSRKASFGPDAAFHRPRCKECYAKARRVNYGTRSIQQLYGITPEQYAEMLAAQGGKCLICGLPERGKRGERDYPLAVDHDHRPGGKVRGLLCNKCNLGIGNFDDDVTRIEAAVAYLRRHSGQPVG